MDGGSIQYPIQPEITETNKRNHKLTIISVVGAVLLVVLGILGWLLYGNSHSDTQPRSSPVITINTGTRYQTIDGFGASERVFDDPHVTNTFNQTTRRAAVSLSTAQQDEVLDKLYKDLNLTRVRAASPDIARAEYHHDSMQNNIQSEALEPAKPAGDPNVVELSKFNFDWKKLDAHCGDYFKRAKQRGAQTFFLSPLAREKWMGTSSAEDVSLYSSWLLAQVQRCKALGIELPYLSVANEPSGNGNPLSSTFIRDVIKNLGPRLRSSDLKTMIVVPDDIRSSAAAHAASVMLADPAAREYIGALATHLYDEPVSNVSSMQTLARQYKLPLWMTEFSEYALSTTGTPATPMAWAELMHSLLTQYNVSAIDYLWGYFGTWEGKPTQLVTLNADSSNKYTGYSLTKTYYMMGQYSRFIEPGARRVRVDLSKDIEVSAYMNKTSLVIVAINPMSNATQAQFKVNGYDRFDKITSVRTDGANDNWSRQPSITARGGVFAASLSGKSVTTFVIGKHPTSNTPSPSALKTTFEPATSSHMNSTTTAPNSDESPTPRHQN